MDLASSSTVEEIFCKRMTFLPQDTTIYIQVYILRHRLLIWMFLGERTMDTSHLQSHLQQLRVPG